MKTVGIISEYDPFHNGHKKLIRAAREITGADCVYSVMSGDFTQRGEPAVLKKFSRAKAALSECDMVFELPFYYATSSAEFFAFGGVSLLSALKADHIAFGSECGEIKPLQEIAEILCDEPQDFKNALKAALRDGEPFPSAREIALNAVTGKDYGDILQQPNNLLGIEYCKAICRLKRSGKHAPEPVTVKRTEEYHELIADPERTITSATAIRTILNYEDIEEARKYMPRSAFDICRESLNKQRPGNAEKLSSLISRELIYDSEENILTLADWNKDLYLRTTAAGTSLSRSDLIKKLKARNITYSRASRMFLSLVTNKKSELLKHATDEGGAFYARLLALRREASVTLKEIKNKTSVPVIERVAPAKQELSGTGLSLLEADIAASTLYNALFCKDIPDEYRYGVVVI